MEKQVSNQPILSQHDSAARFWRGINMKPTINQPLLSEEKAKFVILAAPNREEANHGQQKRALKKFSQLGCDQPKSKKKKMKPTKLPNNPENFAHLKTLDPTGSQGLGEVPGAEKRRPAQIGVWTV